MGTGHLDTGHLDTEHPDTGHLDTEYPKKLFGAVEAGGTKMICAVGTGPDDLRRITRIETRDPESTLAEIEAYFSATCEQEGPLAALGVGSFGPVDLDPSSATWGHITHTPKAGWSMTDMAGILGRALSGRSAVETGEPMAVGFDTDVNAAALAELRWGAAQGCDSVVYVTVGTGIGGGAVVAGRPLHGRPHPEMGHIRVPRHADDPYAGRCPFHGDCLEGLASGPAVAERWGVPGENLDPQHEAWDLEAYYLGAMAAHLTLTLSPQRLVLGGSVLKVPGLLSRIRSNMLKELGGYVAGLDELGVESYLVSPALGDRAGVLGALALALDADLSAADQPTQRE